MAVGDVHGAYNPFRAILRETKIIDTRDRWIGGRAILIQTGDVLDRGADSRRVMDLLRRLERDAHRAGGRVYALLGNHELMRLVGDLRYLSPGEIKAFEKADSPDLREFVYQRSLEAETARAKAEKRAFDPAEFRGRFLKEVPLGFLEMRIAFEAKGEYGAVAARAAHDGEGERHRIHARRRQRLGCGARVRRDQCGGLTRAGGPAHPAGTGGGAPRRQRDGAPVVPRVGHRAGEREFAPTFATILERVQARAFVIGHTPTPGKMVTRFGGRVIQIDSGMLNETFFPGGVPSALEIQGDTLTAVYVGRREPIPAPALTSPSPR